MRPAPRILSHLPLKLLEPVREAFPASEIEFVETRGPVPPDVHGEVLLTFTSGAPNLSQVLECGVEWVHTYGTGVNGFPFELLGDRAMTCSRGASARAISEWVIAALLAAAKQLPETWIDGPVDRWNFAKLATLEDQKLALIGFGGIAQAIARRAIPFGMRVEALRRTGRPSAIEAVRIVTSLDELLDEADHVVVAAPETKATHRLLDEAAFEAMKPGAHLVNIARGGIVDQAALERALDSGRLGRATLDVVTPEPLPEGHWLYRHPRVYLTPHISWSAPDSHAGLIEVFIENLGRFERGDELVSRVDPIEGY